MRVCLILEGSYPYVYGGVSSWTDGLIKASPEDEFVLWTIGARAADRGRFVYKLPSNVVEVHETFLDEALSLDTTPGYRPGRLDEEESEALRQLVSCGRPDWAALRRIARANRGHIADILASEEFAQVFGDLCRDEYPHAPFAQAYFNVRSMALPVLNLLAQDVPQADTYHAISTGYAGLLGAVAKLDTGRPLLLTEHGIYSREREEEIIRAEWVLPYFKRQWIRFFYMLSSACYDHADRITSLFSGARETQIELGAPADACEVIPNGVDWERFSKVPPKADDGWIDIGAPIRIAQIKDVKTMITAFFELERRIPNVRLYIMGAVDDEGYARECHELVETLGVKNVIFTGRQDMAAYLARFDFTILTSISEGQPLSVLESLAARRPVVATDVGCCRDLIEGTDGDELGPAGLIAAPMDHEGLADAMERLCEDSDLRGRMGEAGCERVRLQYQKPLMVRRYHDLWKQAVEGRPAWRE